jgi:hypothetical protein
MFFWSAIMTPQDETSPLVRERAQLQGALRSIRRTVNSSALDDAQKTQKIREVLSKVQALIPS